MIKMLEVLGQADVFLKVQERISLVARVNRPVLVIGERGTGKELAATRLHYLSERWQNPLITLNCAALNPSVLESELFGHEAGAFTGAVGMRKGRFEMAQEGTLFLDEIGTMPMIVQEKILRVIEYGAFERVGGSTQVSVDVRIVAATNADLPQLVREGRFKADLLDRLSFEVIQLPPLRNRREDIIPLARHFAAQMSVELNMKNPPEIVDDVLDKLVSYHWPGNIRELKNAVERAVYQSDEGIIDSITINPFALEQEFSARDENVDKRKSEKLPSSVAAVPAANETVSFPLPEPLPRLLTDQEKRYLNLALEKARFNQRKAAKYLGVTYNQLRALYRKHIMPAGGSSRSEP